MGNILHFMKNLQEFFMNKCNKCGKEGKIIKPGLRCWRCVNDYKNDWAQKKKNKHCDYCKEPFIPNGRALECSLKCKLLNRIKIVNGCWEWQGKITKCGYGEITHNQKYILVHRCSYKEFLGEIEIGRNVCHTCDNKKCINPNHLWIGTQKDNIQDAKKKKRLSKQPMKKFTMEQVVKIRAELQEGMTTTSLAKKYNVSQGVIWNIKSGKSYKEE